MEWLKKILSEETYKKVIEETKGKGKDGADFTFLPNDGSYIPKAKFDEANTAKVTLESERDTYKKELEKLKNSNDDVENLKKQISTLETTIADNKSNYEKTLNETRLESALKIALTGKVQDVDIVSGLIDKSKLTLDENQMSVKMGLEEQLKELQTSKPFLFFDSKTPEDKKVGATGGANPPAGGKAPSTTDMSWGAVLAEKLNLNENQN